MEERSMVGEITDDGYRVKIEISDYLSEQQRDDIDDLLAEMWQIINEIADCR